MTQIDKEAAAFEAWLKQGFDAGWISEPYRDTHDGAPLTAVERAGVLSDEDDMDLLDQCRFAVRLFEL